MYDKSRSTFLSSRAPSASACRRADVVQPDAQVTLTSNPDPASASGADGGAVHGSRAPTTATRYCEYDYRTSFSVTIQETGGLALDITAINLTVQQAPGGIVITPSGGDQVYFKFNSSAPTNHINANGNGLGGLRRLVRPAERRARGARHGRVSFKDDDDNTYSDTARSRSPPDVYPEGVSERGATDGWTLRGATLEDVKSVADIWHRGWRDGHLGHVPEALLPVAGSSTSASACRHGSPRRRWPSRTASSSGS